MRDTFPTKLEEEKKEVPDDRLSKKIERRKYLKKTGKSLWLKNKAYKDKATSLEVSTKSSEGPGFVRTHFQKVQSSAFSNTTVSALFIQN